MLCVKQVKTDKKLEEDGARFEWMGGVFYIRRIGGGNNKFSLAMANLVNSLADADGDIDFSSEKYMEKMAEIVTDGLIAGWENVFDEDEEGNEIEIKYSLETCVDLLVQLPDLMDAVVKFAENRRNFLIARNHEKAKN